MLKMNYKYLIYYFLFEMVSFKIFKILFSDLNIKYEYMEWVYYFYYPSRSVYFYFYFYYIFTTSVFFCFYLWYKAYEKGIK